MYLVRKWGQRISSSVNSVIIINISKYKLLKISKWKKEFSFSKKKENFKQRSINQSK